MEERLFLQNIRGALARYGAGDGSPVPSTEALPRAQRPTSLEEKVKRFMEEARELNGLVVSRVKDWDEARSRLTRMLVERGVKAITLAGKDLDPKNPAWKKWDVATDRAAMEKAELGLVQADYGLAETGSIVLIASKDKPRSASLLPPTCYFALPVSAMLDSMAQLMGILEERHRQGEMPATVNVVTGPSRTADIELSLTVGVHGPGEVHVVLVG